MPKAKVIDRPFAVRVVRVPEGWRLRRVKRVKGNGVAESWLSEEVYESDRAAEFVARALMEMDQEEEC